MTITKDDLQYLKPKSTNKAIEFFLRHIKLNPHVLEIGTRRWFKDPSHHKDWLNSQGVFSSYYTMTDITPGEDVTIVCDAHELSKEFGNGFCDAVWSSSTWEHLHSPWIAAKEVLKILRPGGVFFIQTHFTFTEHGYPDDYFRFTTSALEHLFKDASQVVSCYDFSCRIVDHDYDTPGFLNSCIAGIK